METLIATVALSVFIEAVAWWLMLFVTATIVTTGFYMIRDYGGF